MTIMGKQAQVSMILSLIIVLFAGYACVPVFAADNGRNTSSATTATKSMSDNDNPQPVQEKSEKDAYEITIKDHKFDPATIEIPAGKRIKLTIFNKDPTPEEFESYKLNREKIVRGGGKAIIFIGPLMPGEYPFMGEFNQETAQGMIIVKETASRSK